jgi:hypothetical protein
MIRRARAKRGTSAEVHCRNDDATGERPRACDDPRTVLERGDSKDMSHFEITLMVHRQNHGLESCWRHSSQKRQRTS